MAPEKKAGSPKVGLIGLGLMGAPMGFNWLKKGFELHILPKSNLKNAEALEAKGAKRAATLKDLVQECDVIVLMVPTSQDVERLTIGNSSDAKPESSTLLELCRPEQIVIDMSTSEPESTIKIHDLLKKKNLRFFDAPVTGGVKGAAEGTLTLFLGGPQEWITEAKPVLEAVSQRQFHFGPAGRGHSAKVINNFICIGNMAVLAEALPLAAKLGLEPTQIFGSLTDGMAASRQLDFYGPQILAGDFAPRFRMSHASKDLKIAEKLGDDFKVELPVLEGILELFKRASKNNLDEENVSALIKVTEKRLGAEFRNGRLKD